QVQHGASAELLAGEIEDGVRADASLRAAALLLTAGNLERGDEILPRDGKLKVAIAALRHGRIENRLSCAPAQVEWRNLLVFIGWRRNLAQGVGYLGSSLVEAKIGELRCGMSEDGRVKGEAGLPAGRGQILDGALVAEVTNLRPDPGGISGGGKQQQQREVFHCVHSPWPRRLNQSR